MKIYVQYYIYTHARAKDSLIIHMSYDAREPSQNPVFQKLFENTKIISSRGVGSFHYHF